MTTKIGTSGAAAAAGVAALLLALAAAAPGAPQAAERLVVYTSQPTEQMDEVIALFKRDHPEIEVELFRSGTTEVLNKLAAEFAAGDPQADVLLIADAVATEALAKEGRLMAYPEAPVEGYDPAFYDPEMRYFGTKLITTGIVYNTDLVQEPPTSWKDLAAEAADGQVVMPSPLYSGAAVIHVGTVVAQPGFGWDYFEDLADNGALAARGNGSVIEAVATGQKAYGVLIDYMAFNAKEAGSPVDFVFPAEGVTAITQPVAILATAKNVEAAKAFVDFQLSREAQEHAVKQGYIPALAGVAPPPAYPDLSAMRVMEADPNVLLETTEEVKRGFADLFGG
ncbi:MAG TPA: ABC transporter substrate-binding protein [Geminicoccaceae bacterium]|nr:ABC transporter substrate-binding protein [Geminicoccaceae bacterium]